LTGHNSSKLGHGLREARPTAGVGLAKSTASVGPDPLPSLFWPWVSGGCVGLSLGLDISHFDLVWVNSFYFLHLMMCHVRIECCKMKSLHHDHTIGALILG
jgi:hypothetical protein